MKILKIPFNLSLLDETKRGETLAPDTIEGEMKDIFSTESGEEWSAEFVDVNIDNGNFETTQDNITKETILALEQGRVAALGGDHSVSYGAMRGFSKQFRDAK